MKCGFNRVILSRKGFDSSAGGSYSPFDPGTGRYIVLPIPESEKDEKTSNKLKYDQIRINDHLRGHDASTLKDLMDMTNRWPPKIKGIPSDYGAHFDPWLGPCPWLEENSDHHLGAFGQVGGSQGVLNNQRVGKGSLFLFFSRFRPVNEKKVSKLNDIDISFDHLMEGVAFIYGWLRVGAQVKRYEDIDRMIDDLKLRKELRERHPHATSKYFENKTNIIYLADRYLFDNSTDFQGCGYFPVLSEDLLLTATDSAQRPEHWIPSRWKMPPGLSSQTSLSYLKSQNWRDNNVVQHKGYGQEFVFSESEEFCQWFRAKLLPTMHPMIAPNRWPRGLTT